METDPWELRSETRPVALYLTHDEALVLSDFLARAQRAGDDYSRIEDQAELRVLWDMAAILESWLVAVVSPKYDQLLAQARAAVRDSND